MKVGITDGAGNVWVDDVPVPKPNDYQCLCRNLVCATCTGTDRKIMHNKLSNDHEFPAILGHESIGIVEEVGKKVRKFRKGDMVIRPTAVYSTERYAGFASLWGGYTEYGLITDAEAQLADDPGVQIHSYVQYQLLLPPDLGLEAGDASMLITLKEVLSFADSIGIGLNTPTLITGIGSVGLAFCKAAKILGAYPVIAAARRDSQFPPALSLGADYVIDTEKQDLTEAVMEITKGQGVTRLVDVTGAAGYVARCLPALAPDGKISPYGRYPADDPLTAHVPEERILKGSTGEVRTHDFICSAVRHGLLPDLHRLYSHRMPFSRLKEGFDMIERKEAFKIVFDM